MVKDALAGYNAAILSYGQVFYITKSYVDLCDLHNYSFAK